MAYIEIDVDSNVGTINLGMQGENEAEGVKFDLKRWIEDHGSGGAAFIYIRRFGDEAAYFRSMSITNNKATWDFTAADTGKPGIGTAQVLYEKGDIIKKSVVYKTITDPSEADASGDIPDPYEDYLAEARSILNDILVSKAAAAASATAADASKTAAAASATAAAGSASEAHAYAQQAGSVFAQVGDVAFTVNADKSVTAVFTKED